MVQERQVQTFFTFFLAATFLFSFGCEKAHVSQQSEAVVTSNAVPSPVVSGPGPGENVCFGCQGEGMVSCRVPGCSQGQVDCPGACLKLTRGAWIHLNVSGHDPKELWQKFPNQSGRGGYEAWTQGHVGEVIVYQNGVAVNIGQCKVCGGTTKVTCRACHGTGRQTCEICQGKKFIPAAWSATDNPWFNSQPDVIRLAGGQVVLGRVAAVSGEDNTIVTRDKKILHVKTSDILPKASTNLGP